MGEVNAGTSILVAGPPMCGKRAILYAMAAYGLQSGEGAILITTMETGENVLSTFRSQNINTDHLRIIDCLSRTLGMNIEESRNVRPVNGPMDLTGMGVQAGRLMEEFEKKPVRLCIDSLSTLLMYSSLQTVFHFVHMLNGRIHASGSLGAGVVEEGMHDDRTMATLLQLYNAALEIKEGESASFIRAIGLTPRPTPWYELGRTEETHDQ